MVRVLKCGGNDPVGPQTVIHKQGHLAQHPEHQGREALLTLYLMSIGFYELILIEKRSSVAHWKQADTRFRQY